MDRQDSFAIQNDSPKALELFIEPEGASFPLDAGEEVFVRDEFLHSPVTIKVSAAEDGHAILSIWPGDGQVTVMKNGVDVLDILSSEARARAAPPVR